ncbi:hypothetical protein C8R46DRAFT_1223165 [Mycena filopes]|nr:hypothetical protein C8R46DRAFT_1223165 [Mycena filopes]
MPKNAGDAAKIAAALAFLKDDTTITLLTGLSPDGPEAEAFLSQLVGIHPRLNSLTLAVDFMQSLSEPGTPLAEVAAALRKKLREQRKKAMRGGGTATHREKRSLVRGLGFNSAGRTISSIRDTQSQPTVGTLHNPRIVWRNRVPRSDAPARYTPLSDTKCRPDDDFIVDASHGFYEVPIDESVIFLSSEGSNVTIELVVLRDVASESELSDNIYKFIEETAVTACGERRNVRPTHPGTLVQVGWNAGPRHARVFGLAKSHTKILDPSVVRDHDEDAIAAMTLTWGICRSLLPPAIIGEIEGFLKAAGLPQIATRDVDPGAGFKFSIGGQEYDFPEFERAPPEGMFSQDYSAASHTDETYTGWGLSLNAVHTVDNPGARPLAPPQVAARPRLRSAAATGNVYPPGLQAEDPALWPAGGGGNFVDLTLKVKVLQAARTLMAFRPNHPHGTTRLCGVHSIGCTIPFCTRLIAAFFKAQAGTTVVSGAGTDMTDGGATAAS